MSFQIGEQIFEKVLDDEISYFNPRARADDINSVRSIYVLRKGTAPTSVERCTAVLVTSNMAFSRAAYEYGKQHEETREVSSVITDFSLANMAWLKAPMGAPSLPIIEVLAFAYAALQPSRELLDKYLVEIDRLQKLSKITERDLQLLRSSAMAHEELMRLTLGDEAALTEETVTAMLQRVSADIKKEEQARVTAEVSAHLRTQEDLAAERQTSRRVQERLYWRCRSRARILARIVAALVGILLLAGVLAGPSLESGNTIVGWMISSCSALAALFALGNLMMGITVKRLYEYVHDQLLTWLIKRESSDTGLNLEELR